MDLTTVPPPTPESAAWWPFVMMGLTLLVGAATALWTFWTSQKTAKIDADRIADQQRFERDRELADRRYELQCEQMRIAAASRDTFEQSILEQLEKEKAYSLKLLETSAHWSAEVKDRDNEIRESNRKVSDLEAKVAKLEAEIARLTAHVESLEQTRNRNEGA